MINNEEFQGMDELSKEKYPTPSRYQRNKLIYKIFKKYPLLKDKFFLDICGMGEILTFLDGFRMKGWGIDLSEESIKIARKRVSKNIKIKQGDFTELKKKFGLIIMGDILEHIKNDESFIRKTYELLDEEGYFLITVPAKQKLFGNWDIDVGHYRRYEKDISYLLENNGFKMIEFWSYGIPLLSKFSSFLMGKRKDDKDKNTLESGVKHPRFMKWIYPTAGKFYWILNFQNLFLNTDLGSNYLILCKKIE